MTSRMVTWTCLAVIFTITLSNCRPLAAELSANELRNAKAAARKVEAEWPLRAINDQLTLYVQALGERLGSTMPEGQSIRWSFRVLRDRAPYAFSIGGGRIYLADGALDFARNEGEVAAILAHEIGHQLPDNPSARGKHVSVMQKRDAGRNEPPMRQVGSLTQVYDLQKERAADRWAILILQKAGYDPFALLVVLERLPSAGVLHYYNDQRRTQVLRQELSSFHRQSRQDSHDFSAIQKIIKNEHGQ